MDSGTAEGENFQMDLEKKTECKEEMKRNITQETKTKKNKRRNFLIPRFGCMKLEDEYPTIDEPAPDGSFSMHAVDRTPTHLVVMVNGIIGRSVLV